MTNCCIECLFGCLEFPAGIAVKSAVNVNKGFWHINSVYFRKFHISIGLHQEECGRSFQIERERERKRASERDRPLQDLYAEGIIGTYLFRTENFINVTDEPPRGPYRNLNMNFNFRKITQTKNVIKFWG